MKLHPIVIAVATALGTGLVAQPSCADPRTQSVEFIGMPAPATADEKADIYTKAQVKITRKHGKNETIDLKDLKYHQLMATTETVGGGLVGGLYDAQGNPLTDNDGPMASDGADGTSLIDIPGMKVHKPYKDRPLAMVVNFEYKELPPNDGSSTGGHWSKLPMNMGLAKLHQDKKTGALEAVQYSPIDMSDVNGGWIHCGATLSAWNTHVSSEEYEPDAKVREGLPKAADSDDNTDIASFSRYYFGDPAAANPYHYGLVPEVKVNKDGTATVVKHYAPGRFAREMQEMASDDRTAIAGDDGQNTGLFMFIADKAKDLSAGTLYAAKVTQLSADKGGRYTLQWIRLGHAKDAEIAKLVDNGIKFSEIFDSLPENTTEDTTGYTKVTTYMGTEWLRLKPGMDQAAAFLETRRYAALLGATTEFSKMEYIAYNDRDRKFYLTISRVEAGMADDKGDIRIARNDGGIILEMRTAKGQQDTDGNAIKSQFVGTRLDSIPELEGGWRKDGSKDSEGNACVQDKLCGPDNLRYVESIRTLFLGEDTSRRNNNYVWAFNIDTRKLSRILSVPMNAEATGLTVVPDANGHAYIMSNFQHPGEDRGKPYGTDPLANYKGPTRRLCLRPSTPSGTTGKRWPSAISGSKVGPFPRSGEPASAAARSLLPAESLVDGPRQSNRSCPGTDRPARFATSVGLQHCADRVTRPIGGPCC
jgi:secreted PhoX family phosphatase